MKKLTTILLILTMGFLMPMRFVRAANLTSVSDTLSTLTSNTAANHTILFVTPTGVESSTDTITIDFTDFTIGSVAFGDIDLAVDDDAACDGSWTDKTLAASAAAGTWGAAIASSVLTLTPPTDATTGEITAGRCVQVQIGTNAAGGSNQFTNPNDTNSHTIELAGNFGDTGQYAVDFVADDSVNITGTVDPTIVFAISDTSVGFGTLDASNPRYATGDTTGTGTKAAAHTISISTNATAGYAITYSGATLTSGSDTISVATITGDVDGTQGAEQFAIAFQPDGDATVTTAYDSASNNWSFVAGTATTIVSETGPTATEIVSAYYLANIAGNTEAGTYSTNLTYIATGTF